MDEKKEKDALEEQIRENLQRAFMEKAQENVPDRFMSLLAQLKEQDEASHGEE
ncbi:hypothetical protein HCZ30_06505 [Marivivens donghaensis]|uniref:Anti-sigma factor NepR domain-containing protein n=1 Tax=Marivivens donghaensis TaxID=1699413 RepID=A0ABX0VXD5_9RHOB|nr:NepR family anti-sigma factor [Marivivens donghaensis]NIY72085.1 hypothetical protein [Marivivens donghaensis]